MPVTDPLVALRLFADMRHARLQLIGLDTPDANARAKLIRDPAIFKALIDLLHAAEKLVAAPNEDMLFWHPARELYARAEARFAVYQDWLKTHPTLFEGQEMKTADAVEAPAVGRSDRSKRSDATPRPASTV